MATSQNRTIRSRDPVKIVLPSSENATDTTGASCCKGRALARSGRNVPEPRSLVFKPYQKVLSIGAEPHRIDPHVMRQRLAFWQSSVGVPEPNHAVAASREYCPTIGAERHAGDFTLVLENQRHLRAAAGIPEPHRAVAACGEKNLAVW